MSFSYFTESEFHFTWTFSEQEQTPKLVIGSPLVFHLFRIFSFTQRLQVKRVSKSNVLCICTHTHICSHVHTDILKQVLGINPRCTVLGTTYWFFITCICNTLLFSRDLTFCSGRLNKIICWCVLKVKLTELSHDNRTEFLVSFLLFPLSILSSYRKQDNTPRSAEQC